MMRMLERNVIFNIFSTKDNQGLCTCAVHRSPMEPRTGGTSPAPAPEAAPKLEKRAPIPKPTVLGNKTLLM